MHQSRSILDALNRGSGRRSVFEQLVDLAISHINAERGFLVLTGGKRKQYRVLVARNMDMEPLQSPTEKFSKTIIEQVISTGETVLLADAGQSGAFAFEQSVYSMKLRSVLCSPIIRDGVSIGALYVDNRFIPQKFGSQEAAWVELITAAVALALKHQETIDELAEAEEQLESLKEENLRLQKRIEDSRAGEDEDSQLSLRAVPPMSGANLFPRIIGRSPALLRMFHLMERVLDKDITVLIQGESGTGKELVAKSIHEKGVRKDKPFVAINCGAIPENLIESELFGHVKGAFTDASHDKLGLVQAAEGGTLLLDEIGEMPLSLQTRLLRFLQSGEYQRVGSPVTAYANVRIIAATNKNLVDEVRDKRFREDLYYRLNIVQVVVPPLRDRQEDIPLLVEHFLDENRRAGTTRVKGISPGVIGLLSRYRWPGNVRELEMVLKNASLFADGDFLTTRDFEQFSHIVSGRPRDSASIIKNFSGLTLYEIEREVILHSLEQNEGNKKKTAEVLGIDRRTLYNKLARYEQEGSLKP